jgi:hypothetical protein
MAIRALEDTQDVMTVTPDGDGGLKKLRDNVAWVAIRKQFRSLRNRWRTPTFRRVATVSALALLVVVGITFGVKAVFDLFDEPSLKGISFVNFQPNEEMRLRKAMAPLFTSRCTEAFTNANLRSPLDITTEEGVVLRPSSDLYLYSAEELGLVYDQTRRTYSAEFSSGRAQAGSVTYMRNGVRLTTDGRPRIFIHDSAFLGESFLFGTISLKDVLTHEFIHLGGQPPTPGWLGPLQNDLAGFEHYDEIMGACR